jgi:hypothetical protein
MCSIISQDTGYPDSGFSWLPVVHPGKCQDSSSEQVTTLFPLILSNSLLTNYPISWRYDLSHWQRLWINQNYKSKKVILYRVGVLTTSQHQNVMCSGTGDAVRIVTSGYRSRGPEFDSPRYQIFLRSGGSGTGSIQPRENYWGATRIENQRLRSRKQKLTAVKIRCPDHATRSIR